ncbi:MAG TPA: amidase [Burkholderiaceae bacterium]|nr:amidase [Burkholderiaceae bacterium]
MPWRLSATEAAREIRAGRLSAEDYARALLARIDEREPEVQAWAWLDREHALAQARAVDERRRRGVGAGPLAGLPVGIKDIVDVRGLPTEDGTVLHAGRIAQADAALVARLRAAGGWPMGKTVTTELATYAPGKTRNPHRASHTPGGSSSGSAAAVAAGMVPLAIGTQTNGSVVRPASFCGVVGFKPSFGAIARTGVLTQSPPLDQVGVFARSVEDVALLAEAMWGFDERDPATRPEPAPPLADVASSEPPQPPRLGWTPTPWWDRVAPDAREAFGGLLERLGEHRCDVALPAGAGQAIAWHRTVMEADIAASFEAEYERGRAQLSDSLAGQIERGRRVTAVEYRKAVAQAGPLNAAFAPLFERVDAIVAPATLGTAPPAASGTGDPLMCTLWTFCGMPAISLPLLQGADGLPIGVQLVAARGDDARLLRTARWLVRHFPAQEGS